MNQNVLTMIPLKKRIKRIKMFYKKLLLLSKIQIKTLDEIQKEIKYNGGNVSTSQLIRDSIQIFIDYYKKDAIKKYSTNYEIKET